MIPKIIHYCWLSNDPIPDKLQECMNSWKEKLQGYKFMLWNFDRFDINSSLWVKQAFEAKKYAFAADYIRLYSVYHYGGIYLDMDVKVLKSFDDLLEQPSFIGFEQDRKMEAAVFGASKHSKWIAKMLEYYSNKVFYGEDGKMDLTILPVIMFDVLYSIYAIPDNIQQIVRFDDLTLYPYRYFMHIEPELQLTMNTYTLHLWESSWRTPYQKFKMFILSTWGIYKFYKNIKNVFLRYLDTKYEEVIK